MHLVFFIQNSHKKHKVNKLTLYTITLKEANNFITLGQYPEQSKPQNHLVLDEIGYYLEIHPVEPKTYISYERML